VVINGKPTDAYSYYGVPLKNNALNLSYRGTERITGSVDFNDYLIPGTYSVENASDLDDAMNYPVKLAGKLYVSRVNPGVLVHVYNTYLGHSYRRSKFNGIWHDWYLQNNVSKKISVMSYNLGFFNMGVYYGYPSDILDEKVTNLKKMLMKYAPDIVGLQEHVKYIDRDDTIEAYYYSYFAA